MNWVQKFNVGSNLN